MIKLSQRNWKGSGMSQNMSERWLPTSPEERNLFAMRQEISLVLLNDCLRLLGEVVVFLALEEEREEESKDLLEGVMDCLHRGGRL
jgi:hypothetical protein